MQCPNLPDFDALAGIINTNEGDISPIWSIGNTEETIAVGNRLADAAWTTVLPPARLNDKILVDSRYLEADLPSACMLHGSSLCASAELGNATGHGASDHPASTDALFPAAQASTSIETIARLPNPRCSANFKIYCSVVMPTGSDARLVWLGAY